MKKLWILLVCGLMLCGCGSKQNDDSSVNPTPTPSDTQEQTTTVKLSEKLPESVKEISIFVETSTENIEIKFKDEEVKNVLNQLREMEVSEEFDAYSGSGALSYRLTYVDETGAEHDLVENGNVLRLADGSKTGPLSDTGLIHELVMNMDWVVSISTYEMLTPLSIETDQYTVECKKGATSIYDLAYLKDAGFDPFALGFTVTVDGSDLVLAEMPEEGDYLLILSKDGASYQLKVTSTVK